MDFVPRERWGAPATSPAAYIASTKGVKVHYLGSPYSSREHARCDDKVREVRAAHLANKTEGWVDIAYNAIVCEHGTVYEGRGAHRRTGANGSRELNEDHYAVLALLGSSGMTKPTDRMLHGLRDAIEWLRRAGDAGTEIKGHKDGHATACPGAALYAWVQKGAPRPGGTAPAAPAPAQPTVDLSRLIAAAHADPPRAGTPISYYGVKTVESALVAERLLGREYADGHFGTKTRSAYAAWQRRCGFTGDDADGVPGRASLERLGKKHHFNVKG
ncbi:N-acetylmuramoyl-L-alanine amidase [Streptomyces sp. NPDC051940]|uniref:N-acetylmuramoyl-L-alanine amidase n=1 Tax=Streptomyces sp. NPDC051940 TaxID=3155675 RepID=UPI0034433194